MDVSPASSGTVERTTKELDADAPCSYPNTVNVDLGDDIIIEAVAASGYHFTGWSGEEETLDMDDNPLEITFKNSISITANFAPDLIEFTSQDGLLDLLITEGTTALDAEDEPLTSVEFTADENPPSPGEASIIGQAYNLEPDGARFDPPVTLTWRYTAADIPEGVAKENLVIAYYDENADEWVALDSVVDPIEDIIRASVRHLTTFAILAPAATSSLPAEATFTTTNFSISPAEVNPGSEVTISALITNQGQVEGSQDVTLKINGTIAETQNVTLGPDAFTVVTFEVIKNEAGTYSVDLNGFTGEFTVKEALSNPPPSITTPPSTTPPPSTPSSGINWPVLAAILSAVFLAIFIPIRLKRRRESFDW